MRLLKVIFLFIICLNFCYGQSTQFVSSSLAPKMNFTTLAYSSGICVHDINGDSKPEVLVVSSSKLSIYPNKGEAKISLASLGNKVDFTTKSSPFTPVVADMDGDGKVDIITAYSSGLVGIFRNTSSGQIDANSLAPQYTFSTPGSPSNIEVADLDSDGKLDIILANGGVASETVTIYRNKSTVGSFSFEARVALPVPNYSRSVTTNDFDGDGKIDIALVDWINDKIVVLRNTGQTGIINKSSFSSYVSFDSGEEPYNLTSADLDGDGRPELIASNDEDSTISILRNTATPGTIDVSSFATKADYWVNTSGLPQIGDMDGDSKPDLCILNREANNVSFLINNKTSGEFVASSFSSIIDFAVAPGSVGIALGDLNTDNKPDLLIINYNENYLSVLENRTESEFTNGSFKFAAIYKGGSIAADFSAADFNADGKPELVVISYQGPDVGIFPNQAQTGIIDKSTFGSRVDYESPGAIIGVKVGDIDGDTKPDFVTADDLQGTFSVYRNTGGDITNSSFVKKSFSVTSSATGPCLTDLNGDGKPEMIGHNFSFDSFEVLPNISEPGNVNFGAKVSVPLDKSYSNKVIVGGDLDNDGKNDLVVAWYDLKKISIHKNIYKGPMISASMFESPVNFPFNGKIRDVEIVDVDMDGKKDIVFLADSLMGIMRNISVSSQLNVSSFDVPVLFKTDGAWLNNKGLCVRDLNNDGKPDIIVGGAELNIFENNSVFGIINSSSFRKSHYHVQGDGTPVLAADFDLDGKVDVAVIGANDRIAILTNTSFPRTNQTISSITIPNKTTDDAPFEIVTSASSILPLSYEIISGPGKLTDNVYTITDPGIVVIKISQAGNSEFNATEIIRSFEVVLSTGIDPKTNQALLLFPNPVQDKLFIQSPGTDTDIFKIRVIDACGITQLNENEKGNFIDVSSLKPGKYIVQIFNERDFFVGSIVKE